MTNSFLSTGFDKKVSEVFEFLTSHSNWNQKFQDKGYQRDLGSTGGQLQTREERLILLLNSSINTQSQSKIEGKAKFWRSIYENYNKLLSMTDFVDLLESLSVKKTYVDRQIDKITPEHGIWGRMYDSLIMQPDWGPKTSALFVKNVFNVHKRMPEYVFWKDVPTEFSENDKIYLPVDKVIMEIFSVMGCPWKSNFYNINSYLIQRYSPLQMIQWDDLWFWGFFSQWAKSNPDSSRSGSSRTFGWNSDKYWCQLASEKDKEEEVKSLTIDFLSIIGVTECKK